MASALPVNRGVLRVVSNTQIDEHAKQQAETAAQAAAQAAPDTQSSSLAGYIRGQFEIMRTHRNSQSGWSERLLKAMRAFNGQYDPTKLAQIQAFGGSEVYARLIAMKCRGASALLRDVYMSPDRPWGLAPPEDPTVPENIIASINQLVQSELASASSLGGDPSITPDTIRDRVNQLMLAARQAAKKKAADQASIAEDKIEEMLNEGGFYKALSEFLVDLPLFPFACIKGPVVRIVPTVSWSGGKASVQQTPRLFWVRVSPFDIWFTPGVTEIDDASVIERSRLTRSDINDLLELPGYDHEAVRAVLRDYANGLNDDYDSTDSERAVSENRENPVTNRSGLISCLEFNGNVQGKTLLDQKIIDQSKIADPERDYFIQAWLIGRYVVKVQLSPSPRKRHPYYITSFEKVPGTPVGNGLPDILNDVEDVCNASLRALVNNLSISSGPQVVINTDRLASDEDGEELYPWKRWHTISDPLGNNSQVPISFFQPQSNSQELLMVYQKFSDIGDEVSAIPKFLSGGGAGGGAGRTSSGLAMLMSNASKILQMVSANVDRDVFTPALSGLFDMLMLTDTSGLLTGEEQIKVMGVNVAVQRETQRSRSIEFLTATANPIDAQIMGPKGRSVVLRSVADVIGIKGETIIPTDDELEQLKQDNMKQAQLEALGAGAQGSQKGQIATNDTGPRTNINGGVG